MYEKALPDGMPLEEKMKIAKESGFDHVEFCVDLLPERAARLNWSKEEREKWRSLSVSMGVPFTTFSLSLLRKTPLGMLDRKKNEEAFRVIDEGCRLAVDLGSRVMLVNGYDVYGEPSTPETVARFYENLPVAVGICAYHGVILGIENAEMPFCATVSDAVKYCERVPSPFFRVYGDIGRGSSEGEGLCHLSSSQGVDPGRVPLPGLREGTRGLRALHRRGEGDGRPPLHGGDLLRREPRLRGLRQRSGGFPQGVSGRGVSP